MTDFKSFVYCSIFAGDKVQSITEEEFCEISHALWPRIVIRAWLEWNFFCQLPNKISNEILFHSILRNGALILSVEDMIQDFLSFII